MKEENRLNTSLIDFIRAQLWSALPPQHLHSESLSDCLDHQEFKDFMRFEMYHLLTTNYLVNMTMLGKLTKSMLDAYLEQGATKKGLESLAATLILESCQNAPLLSSDDLPQMVEIIQPYFVQDSGEPSGVVFVQDDKKAKN